LQFPPGKTKTGKVYLSNVVGSKFSQVPYHQEEGQEEEEQEEEA